MSTLRLYEIRLYEISEQYKFLLDELCDEETGVVDQAILAKLNALKEPLENKCINVVRVFKALTAECDAIEKERKAMMAREKALTRKVEFLKSYLLENMELCQVNEIKCSQFVIKLQKNAEKTDIFNEAEIPDEYKKVSVDYDRTMIKNHIKMGVVVPGARLIQGNSVRIK